MQDNLFKVDFQVHLHDANYSLSDVFRRMEQRDLRGIGVLSYPYQESIPIEILKKKEQGYEIDEGTRIIRAKNQDTGKELYLFLGQEIESSDGWHFLFIGPEVDYAPAEDKRRPLENYIAQGLDKGSIIISDHTFADPTRGFADLTPDKEKALMKIISKDGKDFGYDWNSYCIPLLRSATNILPGRYTDVNKKLEKLAEKYDLKIVPTSDTHVKSKWLLNGVGASFVGFRTQFLNSDDEEGLIKSMNSLIANGCMKLHKQYVSIPHFLFAFGLPAVEGRVKKILGIGN